MIEMIAVECPGLSGVEESGEFFCTVNLQLRGVLRQPNFFVIFHNASLLTVSKDLVGSTTVTKRSQSGGFSHFSWSWRAANIMLAIPPSERKTHWLSGRYYLQC